MYSVSFWAPVYHCSTQKNSSSTQKNQVKNTKTVQHIKTFKTQFSLSFPLTQSLSRLCRRRCQLPSPSLPAPVVVAASRSHRSVSASLSLSPSMVGSNYLTKVRTLFFLGLLVMEACIVLDIWGVQSLLPYLL